MENEEEGENQDVACQVRTQNSTKGCIVTYSFYKEGRKKKK